MDAMTDANLIKALRERAVWCRLGLPEHADLFARAADRLEALSRSGGAAERIQASGAITTALGLLSSAIKSGERWSAECEDALAAAFDSLHMLSAAPPPPVGSGWRPIEEAPKDGTMVLLGHEGAVFDGYWDKEIEGWADGDTNTYGELIQYRPTHWMPLPPVPQPAGDDSCAFCARPVGADPVHDAEGNVAYKECGEREIEAQRAEGLWPAPPSPQPSREG